MDFKKNYGMFIPLALMIASLASGIFAYADAKQNITDDLNEAMIAMVNENCDLWTRHDTIVALRQMYKCTHNPVIYQVSDVKFRNQVLQEKVYCTLALIDDKTEYVDIQSGRITSDSIMLVPEKASGEIAIRVQGFADCSMASVFAVSDQTFPGILLTLSVLSMISILMWGRKESVLAVPEPSVSPSMTSIDGIKLTPMQRQLTQMLIAAPGMKIDKATLCMALWGNKSNAEESLYTLVSRTKTALAAEGIELICNRGDSYELRVNA